MFRPCIVIPVFNHQQKIREITRDILALGYTCYLIDDGSDTACEEVLRNLAREDRHIILHRLSVNQGKGVAVCTGLRLAHRDGYSHALQIDADGQHQLQDISRFLAESADRPHNVVTGFRRSKNSPKSRYYGRAVTDIWVWINTLSLQIKDSMCGFRVYPLAETIALLNRVTVGRRMSFDTDILVRLYWTGLDISQIETRVVYSDETPSHFDMWRDNVRISVMHARLFFGMILRVPRLIKRHFHKGDRHV